MEWGFFNLLVLAAVAGIQAQEECSREDISHAAGVSNGIFTSKEEMGYQAGYSESCLRSVVDPEDGDLEQESCFYHPRELSIFTDKVRWFSDKACCCPTSFMWVRPHFLYQYVGGKAIRYQVIQHPYFGMYQGYYAGFCTQRQCDCVEGYCRPIYTTHPFYVRGPPSGVVHLRYFRVPSHCACRCGFRPSGPVSVATYIAPAPRIPNGPPPKKAAEPDDPSRPSAAKKVPATTR